MKVIVCGSRDWDNEWCRTLVQNELGRLLTHHGVWSDVLPDGTKVTCEGWRQPLHVVHGGCSKGADRFAAEWCQTYCEFIEEKVYVADWDKNGKKAGLVRNQAMVDDGADLVLAWWNGSSKGTEYTIKAAVQAGIIVKIIPKPRYQVI